MADSKELSVPKGKRGRPSDYKPEYCQELLEEMSKGAFIFQFANKIHKHVDTLNKWGTDYKDFSEAIKLGKQLCLEHWLKTGIHMMTTSATTHDSKVWLYIMNNLHGWRDKAQVQVTGAEGGPIAVSLDEKTLKQVEAWAKAAARDTVGRRED